MTEISAMYEALDNMDDYALMANVKPIGPHKVLTDAIAELEQLRQRVQELTAERDKATQYWQIAEGRRDELLAALGTLTDVLANIAITSGLYDPELHALKAACDAIASVKEK